MNAEGVIDTNMEINDSVSETPEELTQLETARKMVRKYSIMSAGVGVIPFPIVDMGGILALQLKLISDLSNFYEVKFDKHRVKNFISSLLGSFGAGFAALPYLSSALKFIPGVGSFSGMLAMPVIGGASTYALGQVFIMHFEAGGTLLNFNPDEMKEHFKEEFEKGKEVIENSSNNEAEKDQKS